MDKETVLVSQLRDALSKGDKDNIKDSLNAIILQGKDFHTNIIECVLQLLRDDCDDIKCLTAHAIAEQSICEEKRKSYSQERVITDLLNYLTTDIQENNLKLIKQTCRALGNICCDNYLGRDFILNCNGVPVLVELLPKTISDSNEVNSNEYSSVRLCACKLLLNLLIGGSTYVEAALNCDILKHIYNVLLYEIKSKDHVEECLNMLLLVVSVIMDNKPSIILDNNFNLLVVDILKETKNIEISEMCLEHLHAQSEHDDVKSLLAKAGVANLLWNLLQQHSSLAVNEEKRAVMKLACDLIVLILTGDESMHLLYDNGSGEVYLAMVGWLNAEDMDLVTTAVLAIGNFARTDTHCLHMMKTGVFDKLLGILSSHKTNEDDIRLQHAVLSTLRNLVVPQQNKPLAIERGILPVLTEMFPAVTQYHVVFKLLATLRMLVDGQEMVAVDLVSCGILEQVAQWAARWEHPGVTGEAQRLLAWSVKQLHTTEYLAKFVCVDGCVNCLVNMLVGTHIIMQNEAIVSLTILCLTCLPDESNIMSKLTINDENDVSCVITKEIDEMASQRLVDELVKAEIGKQMKTLIDSNMANLQYEFIENICKLIHTLLRCDVLRRHMKQCEVHLGLGKLITVRNDCQEKMHKLLTKIIDHIQVEQE